MKKTLKKITNKVLSWKSSADEYIAKAILIIVALVIGALFLANSEKIMDSVFNKVNTNIDSFTTNTTAPKE